MVLEQATEVGVIEHCWCVRGSQILDPSIVLVASPRLAQAVCFFPGIQRNRVDVPAISCRDLPGVRSCGQYGVDGFGHPAYRAAYEAACARALLLASTSFPPKPVVVHHSASPAMEEARHEFITQIVSSSDFWTQWQKKKEEKNA